MKNPVSVRRSVSTPLALLAVASAAAAQSAQGTLEQRLESLEQRFGTAAQGEGSSRGGSLLEVFRGAQVLYTPHRGLTISAQDAEEFSINLGGQVQAGYQWIEDDTITASNSAFSVRSARVRLSGNVYSKDVTYFVQMDPSTGADLVDAWAGWRVIEPINIRFGQQKMRSSLQADTSLADTDLEMVDRSIATLAFAGQRATGVLLEGNAAEGKLNWHAGLMNNGTAGIDGVAAAAPLSGAGLLALAGPFATGQQVGTDTLGWTVGGSFGSDAGNSETWSEGNLAHDEKVRWIAGATLTSVNESLANGGDAMTVNLFGGVKLAKGLAGQFESSLRDNDDLNRDDSGFYGQVSYTLAKTGKIQWGGVLRYGFIDFDGPEATEIAGGVNAYYEGHDLKTQIQVRSIQVDNAAGTEVSDTTSIDLLFTLVF